MYSGNICFYVVYGKWLETGCVIESRRLELEFVRKMIVYAKVPRADTGDAKIVTIKWIDADTGDAQNPNYRSRLVGREIEGLHWTVALHYWKVRQQPKTQPQVLHIEF